MLVSARLIMLCLVNLSHNTPPSCRQANLGMDLRAHGSRPSSVFWLVEGPLGKRCVVQAQQPMHRPPAGHGLPPWGAGRPPQLQDGPNPPFGLQQPAPQPAPHFGTPGMALPGPPHPGESCALQSALSSTDGIVILGVLQTIHNASFVSAVMVFDPSLTKLAMQARSETAALETFRCATAMRIHMPFVSALEYTKDTMADISVRYCETGLE